MKIIEINMCHYGSTGNIMLDVAKKARDREHEVETFSTYMATKKYKKLPPAPFGHKYFGSYLSSGIHSFFARLFGFNGSYSKVATSRLLRKIKKFNPDVIHLHNLHNYCINLKMLFYFIKKHKIKTVWTLHDCWPFTGHCANFDMVGCEKWKTGCHDCSQYRYYPSSLVDRSKKMYELKKEWFNGVESLTLVTPSKWLANLTRESFLKGYPVQVIYNGINLEVFKPTESDFRVKYNLENKKIILGVAFAWNERKGLDVFFELSKRLGKDYKIVLVGTSEAVEKQVSENIICIRRTQNQTELAQIYTASDLFVNPTREEALGLVNVESLACGTPVVTFKTGGSPECIDQTCGSVVEKNDVDGLLSEIIRICEQKPYSKEACIERAKKFDMNEKFLEYVKLYEQIKN